MKKFGFLLIDILTKVLFVFTTIVFVFIVRNAILGNTFNALPNIVIFLIYFFIYLILLFIYTLSKHFINKWFVRNEYRSINKTLIIAFKNNKLIAGLLTVFSLLLFFIVAVLGLQRSVIYIPNESPQMYQTLKASNKYIEVNLNNKYYGWFKYDDPTRPTIIYLMGNHENSSKLFRDFELNEHAIFLEYNFIVIDYPKYGNSNGKLNKTNIFDMAELTYDYLVNVQNIKHEDTIVLGFSIGSGPASYLAQLKQVEKLVLVAPYSSMKDAYNSYLPFFYGPLKYLVLDNYDNIKHLNNFKGETIIIASPEDKVIKYRLSKKLSEQTNTKLITIPNLAHNELVNDDIAIFAIGIFLVS